MRFVRALRACLCGLAAAFSAGTIQATQYSYDDLGRLRTATTGDGTAEYIYDAAGNLLSVERHAAGQLVLASFTPHIAAPGATVTLHGAGFSTTPANNTVTINGTAATVTAATAYSLSIVVPPTATSGPVQVSVGGLNSTSLEDFKVEPQRSGPTIAAVSSNCVEIGQSVSVSGAHFDTHPNATRVEIGTRLVKATVSSSTALEFKVPPGFASGRIRVITADGQAESADLVHHNFQASGCGNFQAPLSIALDVPAYNLEIGSNATALLHFDGSYHQLISLQAETLTAISGNGTLGVRVTAPDMSTVPVSCTTLSPTSRSCHIAPLPMSGIHTIWIKGSGSGTVSLGLRVDNAISLPMNGNGTNVAANPGHSLRFAISGGNGERVGVGVNPHALIPASSSSSLSAHAPDNSALPLLGRSQATCQAAGSTGPGCHLNLRLDRGKGDYGLIWTPPTNRTGPSTATFWLTEDVVVPAQNGSVYPLDLSRPGQNLRLEFQGTAGQGISLNLGNLTQSITGSTVALAYFAPDGSTLPTLNAPTTQVSSNGGIVHLFNLPQTGTYSVLIDPWYGDPATMLARLDTGPLMSALGGSQSLSGNWRGQGFRVRFQGQAGVSYGLGVLNLDTNPDGYTRVRVFARDGTPMINPDSATCSDTTQWNPGCEVDFGPLPVTDEYVIALEMPSSSTVNSADLRLSPDVTGSLSGSWQTFSVNIRGGNARLSFTGTPGSGKTIEVRNVASPGTVWFTALGTEHVPLTAPLYGSTSITGTSGTGTGKIMIGDFPINGTYTLIADPQQAVVATFDARVTDGVVSGSPPTHRSVVPGPWLRATLSNGPPPVSSIGVRNFSVAGAPNATGQLQVFGPAGERIYATDGSWYTTCYAAAGGCDFDINPVEFVGNYQALLTVNGGYPPADYNGEFVAASDIVQFGRSATFDLSTPGQNGRLKFSGVAGELLRLRVDRNGSGVGYYKGITLTIYNPDGSTFYTYSFGGTATTTDFNMPFLPLTGDYLLHVDPDYGQAANVSVSIQTRVP